MKYSESIDIYHDILINIKKIKTYLSIFIVKYCDQDLFLDKSWKRYIYIEYRNEDNVLGKSKGDNFVHSLHFVIFNIILSEFFNILATFSVIN